MELRSINGSSASFEPERLTGDDEHTPVQLKMSAIRLPWWAHTLTHKAEYAQKWREQELQRLEQQAASVLDAHRDLLLNMSRSVSQ